MRKKVAPTKEEEVRVLLIKKSEKNELKVTIPADAKLTFGPAIPGARGEKTYGSSPSEYALRIYQGSKENLIAVFTGVREFRDVKMPVSQLVIREAGKSVWKSDENGYEVHTSAKKREAFVPDVKLLNGSSEDEDDAF